MCHAEAHTDYDGFAVRWGLTHHVESAADCCEECLKHAKNAKGDEKKCNVWVYCPVEEGCFSPDIYEHKHQECWLKQVGCHVENPFSGQRIILYPAFWFVSWLFCLHQHLPCLVSFWYMLVGSVEVCLKNILYRFIEGQTCFGMPKKVLK